MRIATTLAVGVGMLSLATLHAESPAAFRKYCIQCHGNKGSAMAGINLEQLSAQASPGESFQQWNRVIAALEANKMPPKGMPQPSDAERQQTLGWIHGELDSYIKKHAGDPGRVTVRRLTSGEYAYTIQDLTGLTLDTGIDASSDSVGGEGFTNFGDVQFMQDANLERYLQAAKLISEHAVIGAGPLEFFADPGKTGFELSAVHRIKDIYAANGFRTISGEGGGPFGLDKYGKAFYVAWRYKNRAALHEPATTLNDMAVREGVSPRFAQHIWTVMNMPTVGYPSSEVVSRWRKIPAPTADAKATETAARAGATEVQNYLTTWPSWFFARGDAAVGGLGDEDPLIFNDTSLRADALHHFKFVRGMRIGGRGAPPAGPAKIYLNASAINSKAAGSPIIVWRNATIAFRKAGAGRGAVVTGVAANVKGGLPPTGPKLDLREVVSAETAERLGFGRALAGNTVGPKDFAAQSTVSFEVPIPEGMNSFDLEIDAELGHDRDQVIRIVVSDAEDGKGPPRGGKQNRIVLADTQSAGYRTFKAGVMEFAAILPPNSNGEPTPADKDPVPLPFDSTYNVPEHDKYVNEVKYIRDDRFMVLHVLDDATVARLNQAWLDLYSSFPYHDHYLALLAEKYAVPMNGKHVADFDSAQLAAWPAEARQYALPVLAEYKSTMAAEAAAEPGHVEDCLRFAARAWRRPLSDTEKRNLRAFYTKTLAAEGDHRKAIRALIARILIAPQFLYRVEQPALSASVRPISTSLTARPVNNWELASRLSFFLWSSIPDDELRRAAAAGELGNPRLLQAQVKRMLADAKARRLSTEFFGQWLGFYRFDQFKGVDTARFPEFTQEVKESMYDEAVSFFEYIVRNDRPVHELLYADYTFLNQPLAKYYGVKSDVKTTGAVQKVDAANGMERGGLLRLGAVLTTTSAPLRTSPVKRGDWILRRVLGTPVPPPPADAGSIPADDKMFGGLSVKDRLQAHKRNATCANCHSRMDPLGFSLEHYDSTGRWRSQYPDGKPIDDSGELADKTPIAGVQGLLAYLNGKDALVRRTVAFKLLGYSLGRTVIASDQPLIDRMVGAGENARFSDLVGVIVASEQFRDHMALEPAPKSDGVKVAGLRNSSGREFGKVGAR